MSESENLPKAGDSLTTAHAELIIEAIAERKQKHPDEPSYLTMVLVLLNIGDRFTPVACINGEWEGIKRDIPPGEGVPKCPNGHVMTEGTGVRLGWVKGQ